MPFIPWGDLSQQQYQTGKAVGDMIRAAGSFYCWAARNYPQWSFGDPIGIGALTRGVNDQLCPDDPPLPEPDQPALPSGKCFCSRYLITYTVDPDVFPPFSASFQMNGPITVLAWQQGVAGTYRFTVIGQNDTCTGVRTENLVANISQASIDNGYDVKVNTITPVGGAPDNCGGQLPRYRPVRPRVEELTRNVNINLSPVIPIITPIVLVRPQVDVSLSPNVNINLSPSFNFPDLGINIGFDIGGVNITNNIDNSSSPILLPPDPRPSPPTAPPGRGSDPDLTELYRRIRRLQDELEAVKECACEPDKVLTPVTLGQGNSGTFNLPQKTRFVVLQLTTIPGNNKFQEGFNAPNVLYAGWSWFVNPLGSLSTREPVDAERKYYVATPNAAQFAYTLYGGFIGTAIAYRES